MVVVAEPRELREYRRDSDGNMMAVPAEWKSAGSSSSSRMLSEGIEPRLLDRSVAGGFESFLGKVILVTHFVCMNCSIVSGRFGGK